jgi:myo-inositol-1(or 4)-monophosphatase
MYEKEHAAIVDACRQAGKKALAYAGRPPRVTLKDGLRDSPVTDADKELDVFLKDFFLSRFPEDGWLSEETEADNSRLTKPRCWVVDPIDGTVGFLKWLAGDFDNDTNHQNRHQFSISIALVEEGQPVVGAVYAPLKAQLVCAVAGQGVQLNGQAAARAPAPPTLAEATYLSSVSETRDGLLAFLEDELTARAYGSVAYKLALTALHGQYVTASVKPKNLWDVAAGDLLCREAGLQVTDLAGRPLRYDQESLIVEGLLVAPPKLYEELRTLFPNAPTGGYR